MLYYFYRIAYFFARVMPRRVCYAVAEFVGWVYCACSKKDKEALRDNFRVILGEDAPLEVIDRHVKNVFVNFAMYLADFFKFYKLDKDFVDKNVEVINQHYLDECLAEGKGVITLSIHFGNWELGGAVVPALGYKMNAIVLEHKDKRINDIFVGQRESNNMNVITLGMKLKRCFKVLEANEVLAIVGDKDYTGDNEPVRFFGRDTFLPRGAAVLSLKTGAPIVFAALVRHEKMRFKFIFEEPIRYGRTGDHKSDVKNVMEKYISLFEKNIKKYPDQWYAFERVWKQRETIR